MDLQSAQFFEKHTCFGRGKDEEGHDTDIRFAGERASSDSLLLRGAAFEFSDGDGLGKNLMDAGTRLKEVRGRLGITTREVALFSKTIANPRRNPELLISCTC